MSGTRTNISAYTSTSGPEFNGNVPYLSLNEEADGTVTLHVRSAPYDTGAKAAAHCISPGAAVYTNDEAKIIIPKQELLGLFNDIGRYFFGEEIMLAISAGIFQAVTAKANIVEDVPTDAGFGEMTFVPNAAPTED